MKHITSLNRFQSPTNCTPHCDEPGTLGQQLQIIDLYLADPRHRFEQSQTWARTPWPLNTWRHSSIFDNLNMAPRLLGTKEVHNTPAGERQTHRILKMLCTLRILMVVTPGKQGLGNDATVYSFVWNPSND